jgi:DNA invertase Pin-like site-specific DNA recombinase
MTTMKIGYARVSTLEQNMDLQRDELKKAGCADIFEDTASGAKTDRTGLADVLSRLRQGDILVVWRLDRLGRSLKHLIETVTELDRRGVGLLSLTENIDTTTSTGRLIFHIFGALAEFERNLIRERTQAGLAAARARGRQGGRPRVKSLSTPQQIAMLQKLHDDKTNSVDQICQTLRISRATLYRYLKTDQVEV